MCEANPTLTGSSGPVDVSAACPVLRAWDLHDNLDSRGRDPVPALREPRARDVGGAACRPRPSFTTPFDASRPGEHAARPEHRRPRGQAGAGRRGHRPALLRDPARRAAARLPVRAARRREDPDPRRPRHAGRVQRDQRQLDAGAGLPRRAARLELREAVQFTATAARARARSSPTRSRPTRRRRTSPTRPACSPTSSGTRVSSATSS